MRLKRHGRAGKRALVGYDPSKVKQELAALQNGQLQATQRLLSEDALQQALAREIELRNRELRERLAASLAEERRLMDGRP